jgi:Zn-dependent protease
MELDISLFILQGIVWYAIFIFSTSFHEAAHAWAAMKMGDLTAYNGGQVTLDPIPHMKREPSGMILIPLISFIFNGGGWMMGWASVPYNRDWAYEHPKRSALMALAGPVANLILVIISGIAIRIMLSMDMLRLPARGEFSSIGDIVKAAEGSGLDSLAYALSVLFALNLILLLFNLIPFPPLDGSAVIQLFMGDMQARRYNRRITESGFGFFGLLLAWMSFGYVFRPVFGIALGVLYAGIPRT